MHRRDAYTLDMLEIPQGDGSGLIWDMSGHIVTNYHVIRGASELQVPPHCLLYRPVQPPTNSVHCTWEAITCRPDLTHKQLLIVCQNQKCFTLHQIPGTKLLEQDLCYPSQGALSSRNLIQMCDSATACLSSALVAELHPGLCM